MRRKVRSWEEDDFLRLRERAHNNRILAPFERAGISVFAAAEGGVCCFDGHATGEGLVRLLIGGFGCELRELLVEFGGLRTGNDLNDVGTEGRAYLDLEAALVCARNIYGFVCWDLGIAAEAIRKKDDCGAITLMA